MALALYRRYRPDTFDGVIGQTQVTVPLSRALDEGKLTHAYLFSGPRGCGKTSSARILARCINCEQGPTSHPCGECASCRDLATGGPGSIDVVEIDAASHNGVDDARELRERAAFAPARDRYKIFILDEAHMVTQQGFNALLKIVEEPPEHVMFIFATTEPEKVIGTIRSRTHHYPFRLVPTEIMGPYLQQICEKEQIKAEPGVLKLAMRAGGGSVRDTLSVLDQLMVGSVGGVIAQDSAVALLGFTPDALIGEAIDAVIERDGEKLYGVVQKVVVGGFDPRRFVEDLLSRVRDLLVLTLGGERAESVLGDDSAAEDMDHLHRQAEALGLGTLSGMAETINSALSAMTGAVSPRMRLELLAARLLAGRDPETATAMPAQQSSTADMAGIVQRQPSGRAATPASRGGFAGANRRTAQQPSGGAATSSAPASVGQTHNDAAANVGTNAGMARSAARAQSVGASSAEVSNDATPAATPNGTVSNSALSNDATPSVMSNAAAQHASAGVRAASNGRGAGAMDGDSAQHASYAATPAAEPVAAPMASSSGSSPVAPNASVQHAAQGAAAADSAVDSVVDGSAAPAQEDRRSVDERWDAAVAALPSDVREYVTRDKVVRVALASNAAGKQRVSMTFDCPLSQHAFALAVSSDEAHRGHKASKVVLAAVRKVFGANTMIAPAPVAANGDKVEPTSRMSGEQLAQVKQQIALAKAGLAAAGLAVHIGAHAPAQSKEPRTGAADGQQDADDPVHRVSGALLGETGNSADSGNQEAPSYLGVNGQEKLDASDGLNNRGELSNSGNSFSPASPDAARTPDDSERSMSLGKLGNRSDSTGSLSGEDHKNGMAHDAGRDDDNADPWAQPAQEPSATASAAAFVAAAGADAADTGESEGARHHKQVSVPDTSDGIDPWAVSSLPNAAASGTTDSAAVHTLAKVTSNVTSSAADNAHDNAYEPAVHAGETSSAASRGNPSANPAMQDQSDPWQIEVHSVADGSSDSNAANGEQGSRIGRGAVQSAHQPQSIRQSQSARQQAMRQSQQPQQERSAQPVSAGAPEHAQVAPEDDEYSLNDESLGAASAMSMDELAQLFEVKRVEDFAVDDPHNPKNIQPPSKSSKHQEG
ncbi:MAG: DNA polymerase III subunit gamma and tau [Bifidobacterium tibiigranuli]|jgi:DNA polymerase-3 subunit gamma/tau|uniref:DNA polymerase III subunit gamma and tau n=1 Tax=Bifidobacterium tibiigranuli TaxID=2172043 RepID=UPI0023577CD4|nr:DNA polymerase III subunit gamma and tau [Bifidobacterium tibiigranuli]MCH3975241.1 DNA polymerase III subunit gamma and tau [Bifidobacterium tibiigranuli]MCH4190575.1 DNA polymerase III subunit gamma and tau [Bifidobacterium tibiigranuli]MCH4203439.1 DNA polymerase III subunit gamma and tau [Bifidobacterium tibiigranuli]MCH4273949.1 DNA polymerase III subunit gamma and tau [Bifidobacterium tibiigranuli]MCI1791189.1 DNA polymerase III subunit gamma and tau [Bifidobacterium tibiigranuli]